MSRGDGMFSKWGEGVLLMKRRRGVIGVISSYCTEVMSVVANTPARVRRVER